MKESQMYRQLRHKVNDHVMLQRIETRLTVGVPDTFFKSMYSEGWIEFKEIKMKSKSIGDRKIPFRPGQYGWIKNYLSLNGNMILACTFKDEKEWFFFKGYGILEVYTRNEFFCLNVQHGTIDKIDFPKLVQSNR
jgi:hypothetical protein